MLNEKQEKAMKLIDECEFTDALQTLLITLVANYDVADDVIDALNIEEEDL